MTRSMTGFGRGHFEDDALKVTIEIKSVNHRYNEVAIRLPKFLNPVEDRIRKQILASLKRGRIDVFVQAEYQGSDFVHVSVDRSMAEGYHRALKELGNVIGAEDLVLSGQSEVLFLARVPDMVTVSQGEIDMDKVWPGVEEALDQAIASLVKMREVEGANIRADLLSRLDTIAEQVAAVEERSPQVVAEYQAKLEEKLNALLEKKEITADPDRVLQEVAIFADRTAITEEIVRLKSHIKQFASILKSDGPVGRKLDFLIQEFNREANTIASKCSNFDIATKVVDIKAEIEKIREQIQNIE